MAEQGAASLLIIQGRVRFREPDVGGQVSKADFRIDAAFGVEYGRAKFVEAESAAAFPFDRCGNTALLALDHSL